MNTVHDFTEIRDQQQAAQVWSQVEPMMVQGLVNHSTPNVDGTLSFHRRALFAMVAAGYHHIRYIQNGTGILGIARSAGYEEHWWFIGSLLNCSYEPPCTPEQLRAMLVDIPCISDPYIHPRMITACQLVAAESGCEFDVPASLDQYVEAAPKKYRSEWNRLMRKAGGYFRSGSQLHSDALTAADQLIDGYCQHWSAKSDSYSDEAAIMRQTLEAFREARPRHWAALVIRDPSGKPVAVNFAWIKQVDGVKTVYDTMCIRDTSDLYKPFSVGVVAILMNIKQAIDLGCQRYSLAGGDQAYKKQFSYGAYTPQQVLNCISEIDIVTGEGEGYFKGEWTGPDNPVLLSQEKIDYIHEQYPFTVPGADEEE